MESTLTFAEKRSFFLFIGVLFLVFIFLVKVDDPLFLSLGAIIIGLFGFLRLTYLLEYKIANIPAFLSLPSRLIFGLHQAEDAHKKKIWAIFQQKEILILIAFGLFYILWFLYCSFTQNNGTDFPREISIFFEKDMPALLPFSYLNIYEVVRHILSLNLYVLVLFLSLSYGPALSYFKGIFLILFGVFLFLFGWLLIQSDLILSLPPFYTMLIEGIGFGQADVMYQSQPEIFLYPLTGLFKNYLEGGMVGLLLFYALHGVIAAALLTQFLKNVDDVIPALRKLWGGIGLFCLFLLFMTHVILSAPPFIQAFQILGYGLVGMCWGAAYPTEFNKEFNKRLDNSQ